jgi:hypothetical protein
VKNILLAIALLCPAATWAQEIRPFDARLGLWESTASTEIAGMPAMPAMQIPPETLAKMPPAQRAQVEAMMKGRGAGSPQVSTTKFCLDRSSLNRALYSSNKSCSTKLVSSTPSTQQVHLECTQGNTKSIGDLNLERVDGEHMKGAAVFKASGDASTGDRSVDIKVTFSNKWVAADCGDVKPVGAINER